MKKEMFPVGIILLVVALAACTPKTNLSNGANPDTLEPEIDVLKTVLVGELQNNQVILSKKIDFKNLFESRFKEVRYIKKFEIKQFKAGSVYYLMAQGEKDGEAVVMALELEQKGAELHASEYNKLYTSCFAKFCDECGFTADDRGEINDCKCQKGERKEEDYSPCEHRTYIKTLEKEF